jgi:hypothetical protein
VKYIPFLLILSLVLLSCSENKAKDDKTNTVPSREVPFEAPAWLWEIPSGSYAIGFGYPDTFYTTRADSLAKDYAAVSISRNHSSFVVDKQAIMNLAISDTQFSDKMDFNVVVSADLDYMRRAYQNLRLLDSVNVMGYMIGLYGFIDGDVDGAPRVMYPDQVPAWCADGSLYVQNNTLYSVASGYASDLPAAWTLAQEKALRQIGKYRVMKVVGKIRATDDTLKKSMAMETVTTAYKAYFERSFIVPVKWGNTTSYRVFISMRTALDR